MIRSSLISQGEEETAPSAPLLLVSTCRAHGFYLYHSFNPNNLKGRDENHFPHFTGRELRLWEGN